MPDFLTKRERSALMSRIRGKNTGIERSVFRRLRIEGVAFSRHAKSLPGRPDVVIRSAKLAVFLDGDFWHGRRFEQWRYRLSPFWRKKIEGNISRDRSCRGRLRRMGWRVLRLWGKDILRSEDRCIARIRKILAR